jgi:hypothetical protein
MTVRISPLDPDLVAAMLRDVDATVLAVAADVGEPADAIRPAVELIAHLLSEARDLDSAMASLRADGEAGAHAGLLTERLLDRYLSTLWAMWELREQEPWDQAVLVHLARRLLHAGDVIVAAVASGYRAVDRELVARDVEARARSSRADRGGDPRRFRRRTHAAPRAREASIQTVRSGSSRSPPMALTRRSMTPSAGSRLGLGILSAGERARSGLTLPQVIGWRGRMVVLAR